MRRGIRRRISELSIFLSLAKLPLPLAGRNSEDSWSEVSVHPLIDMMAALSVD